MKIILQHKILHQFNVTYDSARSELNSLLSSKGTETLALQRQYRLIEKRKNKTPVLDNFGRDLTKLAVDDKLDPVVGREKKLKELLKF